MHTQQDSDAALQNNLTISEKSVIPYTHLHDLQYSWNCFCHQSPKTRENLPQWFGHCRTDSLYLRFCIIPIILGVLDLVSVCVSLHHGNKAPP